MIEPQRIRQASTLALRWLAWLATSATVAAGNAPAQVRVTSLDGSLNSGGQSLSIRSELAADQRVELSKDGRGSFLIGNDALVRLCEGAKARFEGAGGRDSARVELDQGALSAIVRPEPGGSPLRIDTPTASIEVLGTEVHVMVSPGSGTTTVSSLEGRMRISRRGGADTDFLLIEGDEQIAVIRDQALGKANHFERDGLAESSDCLRSGFRHSSVVSDLAQIVAADFPKDNIPLGAASTPSALITELSNAGLDEETCDPITCNPVFQLPAPPICGVPPTTGCIPGP